MSEKPPHGRLVEFDRAQDLALSPMGDCDWGGCDREAWGMRWDYRTGRYLTVCKFCRSTTHPDRSRP